MDLLKMHATTLLRHTTYVETAAPLWSRSFWNEFVEPHLQNVDRGVCIKAARHACHLLLLLCLCEVRNEEKTHPVQQIHLKR